MLYEVITRVGAVDHQGDIEAPEEAVDSRKRGVHRRVEVLGGDRRQDHEIDAPVLAKLPQPKKFRLTKKNKYGANERACRVCCPIYRR